MLDPVDDRRDTLLVGLFTRHHEGLVRLAGVLLGDQHGAEEVVQEAYLRLHGALARLDDPETAGYAYLRRTVVNLGTSRLRRRRVAGRHAPPPPAPATPPDAIAAQRDDQRAIVDGLRELSGRQRACLVLRFYEDLSEREIAAVLGISANSVKTHVQRGMAALAERLEDRR